MFHFTKYLPGEIDIIKAATKRVPKKITKNKITNSEEKLLELKKYIYLFNNLNNEEIIEIVRDVEFLQFKNEDVIYTEDDTNKEIYILLKGKVCIQNKKNNTYRNLITLTPVDIFGEIAFITNKKRNAKAMVVSKTATVIKFIPRDSGNDTVKYRALMILYKNLANMIAKKLEKTDEFL
jgi:CRP-like cAMP-binding protein